jgi:hypothetical protein
MGFYYDEQMADKDLTIRLYPSTSIQDGVIKNEGKYLTNKNPIATAIFNEDFEIEISNNWSDFEGNNIIENLFNSVKPLAGVAGTISDILNGSAGTGLGALDTTSYGDTTGGKVMNWLGNALKKGAEFGKTYLNKALIAQGTRFVYYSGTQIGLGNMVLKYILFYDPINDLSVQEQLEKLLPYAIGDYKTFNEDGTTREIGEATGIGGDNATLNYLGQYFGWQDPPGGFKSELKNVDNRLEGTLKLELGTMYSIDNLVVKGINCSLSRIKVKRVSKSGSDLDPKRNANIPLYGDVTLSLQPAGMIVKPTLLRYLNNKTTGLNSVTNLPNLTSSSIPKLSVNAQRDKMTINNR